MTKRITVIVGWFSSLILLFAAAFWLSKPTFSADMFSLLPKSHSQIAHAEDVFFQQNANRIRTQLGIYGKTHPFAYRSSLGLRPRTLLQAKGYI